MPCAWRAHYLHSVQLQPSTRPNLAVWLEVTDACSGYRIVATTSAALPEQSCGSLPEQKSLLWHDGLDKGSEGLGWATHSHSHTRIDIQRRRESSKPKIAQALLNILGTRLAEGREKKIKKQRLPPPQKTCKQKHAGAECWSSLTCIETHKYIYCPRIAFPNKSLGIWLRRQKEKKKVFRSTFNPHLDKAASRPSAIGPRQRAAKPEQLFRCPGQDAGKKPNEISQCWEKPSAFSKH